MGHVIAGRQDQEVRHHAGVLVRKYVAVEDRLAYVLFVTNTDDDRLTRHDPQCVLERFSAAGVFRRQRSLRSY